MNYYVYILQSEKDGSYYKGFTTDPRQRLWQHNNGESLYTSGKLPWRLVYVEWMESKTVALKREKLIKKATRERIEGMVASAKNMVKDFIDG